MANERIEMLVNGFRERFGGEPETVMRAPGRVNLIGEHTDYNDGFVLPVAIDRDIMVASRRRDDGLARIFSFDPDVLVEFPMDDIEYDSENRWSNYPSYRGQIAHIEDIPAKPAVYGELEKPLPPQIQEMLAKTWESSLHDELEG